MRQKSGLEISFRVLIKRLIAKWFGSIIVRLFYDRLGRSVADYGYLTAFVGPNKLHIVQCLVGNSSYISITPMGLPFEPSLLARYLKRTAKLDGGKPLLTVGRRDRTRSGIELDEFFPQILRLEDALLPNRFPNSKKPSIGFIVDSKGPYYDGSVETDFENSLQELRSGWWKSCPNATIFLEEYRSSKITKFMSEPSRADHLPRREDHVIIGQCTGDQALIYTEGETKENLHLIEQVADERSSSDRVFYRPHPRNTFNSVELRTIARRFGNRIIVADPSIGFVDFLHHRPSLSTMTSGAGLEAAVRGCDVTCYSVSFYSNWGFTTDKTVCARRKNILSVEDVFLFMYTKYTRYIHPYGEGYITPLQALRGRIDAE